jgi:hypothetical protein
MTIRRSTVVLAAALMLTGCSAGTDAQPSDEVAEEETAVTTPAAPAWSAYEQALLDNDLKVGDCTNGIPGESLTVVDCAEPHEQEIYSVVDASEVASFDALGDFVAEHYNTPVEAGAYYSAVNEGTSGISVHGAWMSEALWESGYTQLSYYLSVPDNQVGSVKGL